MYAKPWHQAIHDLMRDRAATPLDDLAQQLQVSARQIRRAARVGVIPFRVDDGQVVPAKPARLPPEADSLSDLRPDQRQQLARRFYLLYLLVEHGERGCARPALIDRITSQFDANERAVERDLKDLSEAELIQHRRSGGQVYVSAATEFLTVPPLRTRASYYLLSFIDQVAPRLAPDHAPHLPSLKRILSQLVDESTEVQLPTDSPYILYQGPGSASQRNRPAAADSIESAAVSGHRLRLTFTGTARPAVVSPLGVVYVWTTDRWYVVFAKGKRVEWRRLDSLAAPPEALPDPFEYPHGFRLDRYFEAAWGVEAVGRPEPLRFRCYGPNSAIERLLLETAHRPVGRLAPARSDGSREYSDVVQGDGEVDRWLREFGSSIEILEPALLREKAIDRARRLVALYEQTASVTAADGTDVVDRAGTQRRRRGRNHP